MIYEVLKPIISNHQQSQSSAIISNWTVEIHPFGCPVCVLASEIASGKSMPRWDPWACLGCYLGPSPHHAANVNLILNPATGYISPQFHCTYDDYFETPKLEGNIDVHWKRLAHLRENEETELFNDEFDTVHGKPLKEYEPAPSLIPLDEDENSEYDSDSDDPREKSSPTKPDPENHSGEFREVTSFT